MVTRGMLVFLAACCILVSAPVSYLVNTYRMANSIPPSDGLTILVKFLPLIALSIVIAFGTRDVVKLANSRRTKEATHLIAILTALLVIAIVVAVLAFGLGEWFVL